MRKIKIISAGFAVWFICGSGVNPQVKQHTEPKVTIQNVSDSAHKLEKAVERLDALMKTKNEN